MYRNLFQIVFVPAFLLIIATVIFLPDTATAQTLVPCEGPDCNFCHFVTLANNVIAWLIGVLAIVFGVMVFAAGIGLVTSGGNPSKLQDAKKSLTNALIGLIIVLAAWLIVDTLLKATLPNNGATKIGPWNQISCQGGQLVGDPYSGLTAAEIASQAKALQNMGKMLYGGGGEQCSPSNAACSVSKLMSTGLTNQQANVMSCIAMTESSGNPLTPPYNITNPNAVPVSTACGTFQITKTTWDGTLKNAPGSFLNLCPSHAASCRNADCNALVMTMIVKKSGYSAWTCPGCNNKAQACINKYSGV